MARLRLGVIGAGSWAVRSHLPQLAQRRDVVDFVGVCRHGLDELTQVRDQFGFSVASQDYADVLDAGIDIAVVGSPAALHYEHAKAALLAGAHVLVEKPFTIRPEHAWELVDIAQRHSRHLLVAYGYNYKPFLVEFKRLCDSPGIGTVESVAILMSSVTRDLLMGRGAYPEADQQMVPDRRTWTDLALSGGGYGQAQLTHALGLALWLTGLRGRRVSCLTTSPPEAPVELHMSFTCEFENGAIGAAWGSSAHLGAAGNTDQLEVRAVGTAGQLHVDVERERAWMFRPPDIDTHLAIPRGGGKYDCDGPPNRLVDLALGRTDENNSPGELGARTVEILDAAYRSAASGRTESVASARVVRA